MSKYSANQNNRSQLGIVLQIVPQLVPQSAPQHRSQSTHKCHLE